MSSSEGRLAEDQPKISGYREIIPFFFSLDNCRVLAKYDEPRDLRVQDSHSVIYRFITIISTKYLHLQHAHSRRAARKN